MSNPSLQEKNPVKNMIFSFLTFLTLIVVLFTCTKDTIFNPTDIDGITIAAYACDTTGLDTALLLTGHLPDTVTALSPYAGQTVTFLGFIKGDSASVKDITWSWDFGDGGTSEARIVEHRYMTAGTYKAIFTITNSVGVSLSDTVSISSKAVTGAAVKGYAFFEGKSEHDKIKILFYSQIDTVALVTAKSGLFQILSNFPADIYSNVIFIDEKTGGFSPETLTNVIIADTILNELGKTTLNDKSKPYIVNYSPSDTINIRNPQIKGYFIDTGSGISKESFVFVFNGDTIADSLISCNDSGFCWKPSVRLPDENYSVFASISDSVGNKLDKTWSFTVDAMKLIAYGDTTVSIYDTVNLSGKVENVYSNVAMYKWDFDGNGIWDDSIGTSDSSISTRHAFGNIEAAYKILLYGRDDIATVKYDTVNVTVANDPSIAVITAPDSARLDSCFTISSKLSSPGNFGKIVKHEWSIGDYNNFKETSEKDTLIQTSTEESNKFPIVLKVTDDDGNVDFDTEYVVLWGKWEAVGNKGFSEDHAEYQSLAIWNKIPYVAFCDGANGKTTVMRFNGASWETVGIKGFSDGQADYVSLKLNDNGMLYIAFKDESVGGKVTVMRYR